VPLVLDPDRLPRAVLAELVATLRAELEEAQEMVHLPPERVRDPGSFATAAELLASARALIDLPGDPGAAELAARANLAYATIVAVVDLVKSHSDLPKVPPPRSRTPAPGGPGAT
jgi:hypothetical protein